MASARLPDQPLLDGVAFPEAPRWRAGVLWFSDMVDRRVCTVDSRGAVETVARFDEMPGGIGFLGDGTPLVVGMASGRVFAVSGGAVEVYAQVGEAAPGHCDDMAVAADGTAYVGVVGDVSASPQSGPPAGSVVRITPDGKVNREADTIAFPNGMVVCDDGVLLVNETFAERITAFDIADDGRLENRRVWAWLPGMHPDGLAVDADGAAWVGCYSETRFVRVCQGGEVTDVITTGDAWATGVALGGDDADTLYLCTARTDVRRFLRGESTGRIDAVAVPALS